MVYLFKIIIYDKTFYIVASTAEKALDLAKACFIVTAKNYEIDNIEKHVYKIERLMYIDDVQQL